MINDILVYLENDVGSIGVTAVIAIICIIPNSCANQAK